jgi:hypothetical protein
MGATLRALAGHLGEIGLWAFALDTFGAAADIRAAIYSSGSSCVVDRDGRVALEAKAPSSNGAIAAELAKAPATKRIVFETGRIG